MAGLLSCQSGVATKGFTNLRITIQHQLADLVHGELRPRPDLRSVKGVEVDLGDLLRLHDLDHHRPAGIAALLDVLEEVALREVRVLATDFDSFVVRELFDTLPREPVVLR